MADIEDVDTKKSKKEAKRKEREEQLKSQELPEYEKFNVKHKDEAYQNKQKRHEEQEQRKQDQEEEKKRKQKTLDAEVEGKQRHSKPVEAKPPFKFYLEEHSDWEAEKVKQGWAALPEEQKQKYKNQSKEDRERYKMEMEEYNNTQEMLKAQKGGKKARERRQ